MKFGSHQLKEVRKLKIPLTCHSFKHCNFPSQYIFLIFHVFIHFHTGLLRLQQIYQTIVPGNETFRVDIVKRIGNVAEALDFLHTVEELSRWTHKYIVLDCSTSLAKQILVSHVRDVKLGKRTYHYLLSGLVSKHRQFPAIMFMT